MSGHWLSLLIPVFNVERYLQACLDSIMAQMVPGVEIIVLDDQSTDGSYDLLRAYAEVSPYPISLLQHPRNRGLSAARNTLLEAATGEYLWFLDSDDLLQLGAICSLRNIIDKHQPDMILCDYQVWRSDASTVPPVAGIADKAYRISFSGEADSLHHDPESLFAGLYAMGKLHAWSKITKRSLWASDLRFPEGRYFEDMFTTPRLALKVNSYFYCAQPWVIYRQRDSSILANFNIKKIDDMVDGLDGVIQLWERRCPNMSAKTRYFFLRYGLKIYAFVCVELKAIDEFTFALSVAYRNKVLAHIKQTKLGLVLNFLRVGDVGRAIKAIIAVVK